ncbi:XRE family DNA-binding transcriptional regulator [Desulfuromonas soudanensis]|uniref:XRE family DNA-binding transcriptional regulator n=1 Tax=Desulfuromonas soudanensis TaxID=1603606 RepID=A0A0M4DH13_9BACT|nr:helix-turn-helix transcriptional regulator [Desulfuromonas soudanensis]ALC16275.1 XRE family DNA-binding transcriptional regulator [Desulfuromonas soudanensis]
MTNIVALSYPDGYYFGRFIFGLDMIKQRAYSKYAKEAAFLLGQQIKLGRKERHWSEQNLASRAGISRATLQKIEAGEMSPSIGLVFEVATLVGVPLFVQENRALATSIELTQSKIALLPKRIKNRTKAVDDDF